MQEASPENWLKDELTHLLELVQGALDTLAWLPFGNSWTLNAPGTQYLMMLKQMEEQLLRMWVRMQRTQWTVLEIEVIDWHGQQKRGQDGVLGLYYSLFEVLTDWGSLPETRKQGLRGCWDGFLISALCQEEHLMKRLANSKIKSLPGEILSLAGRYLKLMQVLRDAEPRQLCYSFYTLLSPFTRDSVYLPFFPSYDDATSLPETDIGEFSKLLLTSTNWESKAEEYLKLLQRLS